MTLTLFTSSRRGRTGFQSAEPGPTAAWQRADSVVLRFLDVHCRHQRPRSIRSEAACRLIFFRRSRTSRDLAISKGHNVGTIKGVVEPHGASSPNSTVHSFNNSRTPARRIPASDRPTTLPTVYRHNTRRIADPTCHPPRSATTHHRPANIGRYGPFAGFLPRCLYVIGSRPRQTLRSAIRGTREGTQTPRTRCKQRHGQATIPPLTVPAKTHAVAIPAAPVTVVGRLMVGYDLLRDLLPGLVASGVTLVGWPAQMTPRLGKPVYPADCRGCRGNDALGCPVCGRGMGPKPELSLETSHFLRYSPIRFESPLSWAIPNRRRPR